MRNPFTPNDIEVINSVYNDCLANIVTEEKACLTPILKLFKQLGAHVKSKIAKRAKTTPAVKNTIDSVYVLYVVSSGVVSDFSDVSNTLKEKEWCTLPLQL